MHSRRAQHNSRLSFRAFLLEASQFMPEKIYMTTDLALLAVLALLWGASYTFIKIGVETIPPVTFIAARTLIAGFACVALF